MHVRQVRPHHHFPSGDSRALVELRFDPEELAARYGLTFAEDYDDLDWFELAAIELGDGSQAWLTKYRGEQEPGTTVYVDAGADPVAAKEQLARALGLGDEDFCWVAPELDLRSARM